MKLKTFISLACVGILFIGCTNSSHNNSADYTQYMKPFTGSEGTGHTFSGPCMPFGMVQPGPDNVDKGWDYTSGYQYKDSIILGFSQIRANGTGINEFGDVLLQPFTDERKENFGEAYLKRTEKHHPAITQLH